MRWVRGKAEVLDVEDPGAIEEPVIDKLLNGFWKGEVLR